MSYDEVEVELPDTGLVLVTGGNGEGKSGLIEMVPVAGWNKTLRGTPWFREEQQCFASMTTDTASILRQRTKGGKNKVECTEAEYDTASKAQPAIESLIGSLDVWRKTSVFSSAAVEGAHFSSGTDAERKRLLESILGLDKFDGAFSQCGVDLRAAESDIEKAEREFRHKDALMKAAELRAKDARDSASGLKLPTKTPDERIEELGVQISALLPDLDQLKSDKKSLAKLGWEEYGQLTVLQAQLDKLKVKQCPTCTQAIPKALVKKLTDEAGTVSKEYEAVLAAAQKERGLVEGMLEELEEEVRVLALEHQLADRSRDDYKHAKAERARLEAVVRDSAMQSTRLMSEKTAASSERTKNQQQQGTLTAVHKVLGMRGVRAQVLAHSLGGLSTVANTWLQRMGSGFDIDLSPYTEKKTGGTSEAIAVNIKGAGGGFGYNACSAGQRRRVDVAIILALATMASAAHGVADGTLFFDECFDVLDQDGTSGVASALDTIARHRCVVVISHSASLQQHISAAVHLHVEGGKVLEM